MRWFTLVLIAACNADPGESPQGVLYRNGLEPGEPNSGERGSIVITEILWSGSVNNDGVWDRDDVFIEISNNSNRKVNLSGWQMQIEGTSIRTLLIPDSDVELGVGSYVWVAAKSTGCFPEPTFVVPDLQFPYGDPFSVTLFDKDERLMEPAGNSDAPPFAGGWDYHVSRSMEKAELMFGARGGQPAAWHFYTDAEVDVPNNDLIADGCRERTLASPGRPNSPDYSGSFASGEAF
jgi:hypothetical protein